MTSRVRGESVKPFALALAVLLWLAWPSVVRGLDSEPPNPATSQPEAPAVPEAEDAMSDEEFSELTDEALPSEQQQAEEKAKAAQEVVEPEPDRMGPPPREEIDPAAIRAFWDQGIRIERNDKRFRMKIGGRFQYDVAYITGDSIMKELFSDGFDYEIRRAWLDVSGVIRNDVIFKVQIDLAGNSSGDNSRNQYLRENYLGWTVPGTLNGIRVGVSKEPFAMDESTSNLTTLFMERATPMVFAPSYNLGILVNGQPFERRVSWSVGAFRYIGDGGGSTRLDLTGRIVALPFVNDEEDRLLHVGLSYSHQFRNDFDLRYRRRPECHLCDRYVDTKEFAVDGVDLLGFELAGKWGPLYFQSEYVSSLTNRSGADNASLWGAYAQVGYFLTGESRSYRRRTGVFGRVRPRTYFDWSAKTWGAFEVGARFSSVDLDDEDIRGGILNDLTLGINWYPRAHLRLMLNYVRAHKNGTGTSDIWEARFQIDY